MNHSPPLFLRPSLFLCLTCLISLTLAGEAISQTSILFVGDTHFGENYQENLSTNILATEGYQYTIENFSSFLTQADAVIANLETPVTDLEESPFTTKSYLHWADPVLSPLHLILNNISVVSLANNHTLDYGVQGLDQTLDILDSEGISWFGAGSDEDEAGEPYVHEYQVGNQTFTLAVFGAYEYRSSYAADYDWYADETNPGAKRLSAGDMASQILALKDQNPDVFVVAFPHWGSNYRFKTTAQTEMGHDLINSGADMVIGHGAHMLQEVELYQDKWIVYSLGNMVFGSPGRYASENAPPYGFILELALEDNDSAVAAAFRLYPIFTDNRITNYQSRYVSVSEFDEVADILLDTGGTGSWDDLVTEGRDSRGNDYLEFPLIDGLVETEFMYDNFEVETLGNYTLGSTTDAELKVGSAYCLSGSCIRIQDDRGIESSFFTTNSFDASGQDRLEIDFWTRSRNGEDGESYLVKYFDGTGYRTVATFVQGTDYVHNEIQNRRVVIDSSTYTLSPEARILFEASGSGNSDDFYFDQIRVSGFSTVPEPGSTVLLISGVGFLIGISGNQRGRWRR
jgi:hypothetical protein